MKGKAFLPLAPTRAKSRAHHGASAFVLAQLTALRERQPAPVAHAGVVTEEQYAGSR